MQFMLVGDGGGVLINPKRSPTQPVEPIQSQAATLLEWCWDPSSTLNGGGDSVLSTRRSPMQPIEPSQSHSPLYFPKNNI